MSRDVLWNDGQGIDYADLNKTGRLVERMVLDELLHETDNRPGSGISHWLRTVGRGLRPYCTDADMILKLDTGSAIIETNSSDQDDHAIVQAHIPGILSLTIATAHATLERWDIVVAKLTRSSADGDYYEARDFEDGTTHVKTSQDMYVQRTTTVEAIVVAGTADATPEEPAVPSGYQKIARVQVQPQSAHPAAHIHNAWIVDFRKPLGNLKYHVPLSLSQYAPSEWAWGAAGAHLLAAAGSKTLILPLHVPIARAPGNDDASHSARARLKSITIAGTLTAGFSVLIGHRHIDGTPTTVLDISTAITAGAGVWTFDVPDTGVDDEPGAIWLDGGKNTTEFDDDDAALVLVVISGAASDEVAGVAVECWGG